MSDKDKPTVKTMPRADGPVAASDDDFAVDESVVHLRNLRTGRVVAVGAIHAAALLTKKGTKGKFQLVGDDVPCTPPVKGRPTIAIDLATGERMIKADKQLVRYTRINPADDLDESAIGSPARLRVSKARIVQAKSIIAEAKRNRRPVDLRAGADQGE